PAPPTSTPSLHDALPIFAVATDDDAHSCRDSEYGNPWQQWRNGFYDLGYQQTHNQAGDNWNQHYLDDVPGHGPGIQWHVLSCQRSEEHTSELQSRFDLVC